MSEDFQTIEIPIGGGLDQTKPTRRITVPKAITALNLRLDKDGSYARALGYDDLTDLGPERVLEIGDDPDSETQEETTWPTWPDTDTGATVTDTPNALFAQRGAIAQVTLNGLYTHDTKKDRWDQPTTDSMYGLEVDCYPVMNSGYIACNPDLAIGSKGTLALVWQQRTGDNGQATAGENEVYVAFFDAKTMSQLKAPSKLSGDFRRLPRVVATTLGGEEYFTVFALDASTKLSMVSFNADDGYSAGAVGSQTSANSYDVHAPDAGAASYFCVGYNYGSGGRFRTYTPDELTIPTSTQDIVVANTQRVAVYQTSLLVYAAVSNNAGTHNLYRFGSDFSAVPAISVSLGSFPSWIQYDRTYLRAAANGKLGFYLSGATGYGVGPSGRSRIKWGTWMVKLSSSLDVEEYLFSRHSSMQAAPVYSPSIGMDARLIATNRMELGTKTTLGITNSDLDQYPACFVQRLYADRNGVTRSATVARCFLNPGRPEPSTSVVPGGEDFDSRVNRSNTVMYQNEAYFPSTQIVREIFVSVGASFLESGASRILVTKLRGVTAEHRRCLTTARGTYVGAGSVSLYDGVQGGENSHHGQPTLHGYERFVDLNYGNSSMGSTADGDPYQGMRVVLVWFDAYGRKHRSPPSNAIVFSVIGNAGVNSARIDYSLPDTAYNNEVRKPYLEVYISETVRDSGPPSPSELSYYYRGNIRPEQDPTFAVDSFNYHFVDYVATGGTLIYDLAGEVTSDPTLAPWDLVVVRDRMFYIPPTRDRIKFSKPYNDGFGYEFNDSYELVFPVDEGRLTALAGLDDKLIIFSENGIHVFPVSSSLPNAAGAGTVGLSRRIPSDVGCTMPRSVLPTSGGVYFASQRGLHILDRNMQVQYLGDAAEEVLGLDKIRAAIINPAENEARFYLKSNPNVELVHNYDRNEWMTREHPGQSDLIDAWYDGERVAVLFDDFTVSKERRFYGDTDKTGTDSQGFHPNSSEVVALKWRSGWINLAGVAGFQRIRRLFILNKSENFLDGEPYRVSLYYDYSDTAFTSFVMTQPGDTDLIRRHINRQKCSAFSIQITQDSTGNNQQDTDFSIEGLQIEVALKGTGNKKAYKSTV
jgi:hypothetical protein